MKAAAKILRWFVGVIACLWLLPAAADCEDEAYAARTSIFRSGPFYFETTRFSGANYRVRECGELDPFKAEHARSCGPNEDRREYISLENGAWENDGFGWYSVSSSGSWRQRTKLPSLSLGRPFSHVTCHGRVRIDGRDLNKYEFAIQTGDRVSFAETVFVDAGSGRPVRLETSGPRIPEGSVTIYRHDPLIRIEPPPVDLARRRARSLRHFQDVVQDTEPACRDEVLTALRRGQAASFQYDLRRFFHTGLSGMHGVFVAPGSIHNRMLSRRIEMELIAVGEKIWRRVDPQWVEAGDLRRDVDWIVSELTPNPDHVGHVRCLGKVTICGREYRVYHYDLYRDQNSALKFHETRRVLVEDVTGLPWQTVGLWRSGARGWVETRWYDPALTIEPPPTVSSTSQNPAMSLRLMTDEEYRQAILPEQRVP
jgi:hypothetical protein